MSSGLPSGGLSKLDSAAGLSSTTAESYVSSMNSYASAYASAGSGNIGNVATAVGNAATLLNNGSYFNASYTILGLNLPGGPPAVRRVAHDA